MADAITWWDLGRLLFRVRKVLMLLRLGIEPSVVRAQRVANGDKSE